jgi:hypothetical protein
MTTSESLYVYGIVPAGAEPPPGEGVGDPPGALRTVVEGHLAALVSPLAPDARTGTRGDLAAHDRVLGEALARTTVVPMRFGIVMDDEETVVEALLRRHEPELTELLSALEGHVQMTLRGYYLDDVLVREVVRADPAIARAHARLRGQPEVRTQGERIAIGQAVAAAAARRREADEHALLERVAPVVAEVRAEEPANERVAVNLQLLVHRDRRAELDALVGKISEEQSERMAFRYVGPIPPYSFADVALEA